MMKQRSVKEQMEGIKKRPIPRKRVGIVRLEMVKEETVLYGMHRITDPKEAADMIRPLIEKRDRELMIVLSLDQKLQPMAVEIVAVGGIDVCLVDVRCVFKHALLNNASYIMCFHNHPSGLTEISQEDRQITKRLKAAGDILGVRLLDHIILGAEDYCSMRELGECSLEPGGDTWGAA